MANTYKQLGQARENSTNAVSVYSPPAGAQTIIKTILITNTSGASATVRVFVDDDGTTYDESTAIVWDAQVPVNDTLSVTYQSDTLAMNNSAGNLAYKSSVANALTITVFGLEIT